MFRHASSNSSITFGFSERRRDGLVIARRGN
jgi:hypothetical protein